MWLNNEVLLWKSKISSFIRTEGSSRERAYEILEHAESILRDSDSALHRGDCITNLKRAINHRLKSLNELYRFDEIFKNKKPKRLLEQLALLGIIKPMMLEKLILIRNEIEHEDKQPPSKERCQEFTELSWYFLKSTDRLVSYIPSSLNLVPTDVRQSKYYWLEIRGDLLPGCDIDLRGWVQPKHLSKKEKPAWIKLQATEVETRINLLERIKDEKYQLDFDRERGGRGLKPNDMHFKAKVCLSEDIFLLICKQYFSSAV